MFENKFLRLIKKFFNRETNNFNFATFIPLAYKL